MFNKCTYALLLALLASIGRNQCSDSLVRTKRIDDAANADHDESVVRTKRIDGASGVTRQTSRTKRIDGEQIPSPRDHADEGADEKALSNDISDLPKSLLGPCRGQKVNQTIELPNCLSLTVQNVICGGLCDIELQPLVKLKGDMQNPDSDQDTCSFCGPSEYEEKLLLLQCHGGSKNKQQWKLEVKKVNLVRSCKCIKDSCSTQNKISSEQTQH